MSLLTSGVFSAHLAFPSWLDSKEAQDSILIDVNSLFFVVVFLPHQGSYHKSSVGGRCLNASISQQVSQGNRDRGSQLQKMAFTP